MNDLKDCPFCGKGVRWCGEGNKDPKDDHECDQITCDTCVVNFNCNCDELSNLDTFEEAREVIQAWWEKRV